MAKTFKKSLYSYHTEEKVHNSAITDCQKNNLIVFVLKTEQCCPENTHRTTCSVTLVLQKSLACGLWSEPHSCELNSRPLPLGQWARPAKELMQWTWTDLIPLCPPYCQIPQVRRDEISDQVMEGLEGQAVWRGCLWKEEGGGKGVGG